MTKAETAFYTRAQAAGAAAFAAGIKSAPCLDPAVMPLLREANPTGKIGCKLSTAVWKGWANGWHTANLASN
jgi:hypothetical protein